MFSSAIHCKSWHINYSKLGYYISSHKYSTKIQHNINKNLWIVLTLNKSIQISQMEHKRCVTQYPQTFPNRLEICIEITPTHHPFCVLNVPNCNEYKVFITARNVENWTHIWSWIGSIFWRIWGISGQNKLSYLHIYFL